MGRVRFARAWSTKERTCSRAIRTGASLAVIAVTTTLGGACLPGRGPELNSQFDAEAPPPTNLNDDGGAVKSDVDLDDPFPVVGLVPSHGPWTGGTRAQ